MSHSLCKGGLISLPNDRISDWSKLKTFADDKLNTIIEIFFGMGRKHVGKRRKC